MKYSNFLYVNDGNILICESIWQRWRCRSCNQNAVKSAHG